ncbi:hypothetical protein SAY87_030170 [Trapa incisa]|uniref:Dof zinc finger protein n=1 Tax=Trapa incisa TaxID=236973 RepID=A0AAN7Q9Y2_9MYRT|nr:hypothetical protein SAY87_030170 [Trapa incisa]
MEHASHQWPQQGLGVGFVNRARGIDQKLADKVSINHTASDDNNNNNRIHETNKLTRPGKDQALNCPRCNSLNTKFCYYNNYSLSQPRYFCKACRRYWTQGGCLRNVPVGGGSRKKKRSSLMSSPSSSPIHPHPQPSSSAAENYKHYSPVTFPPKDLNLPNFTTVPLPSPASTVVASSSTDYASLSAYKGPSLMMTGSYNFMQDLPFSSGGFHSTMPTELFKPTTTSSFTFLDFSLQARNDSFYTDAGGFNISAGHGNFHLGLQESEAKDLFPVSDPKQPVPINDRATGDQHQKLEQKKSTLGEVDSSPGTDFWNQGLLLSCSTSWMDGSQIS